MDARILDAALRVYAARGKAGFSIDVVAKAAGCSRPAVYARWPTRTELLLAAVRSFDSSLDVADTGPVRDQLVAVASHFMDGFSNVHGMATFRIVLDSLDDHELLGEWEKINEARLRSARDVIGRGIERGELPAELSAPEFFRSLFGAAMLQGIYDHLGMSESSGSTRAHADRLVDFLLGTQHR